MISSGDGDDAARALVRRERLDGVEHAARLERSRVLKQFELERHAWTAGRDEGGRGNERRSNQPVADDPAGSLDVVE